jgi:hypothetical protein
MTDRNRAAKEIRRRMGPGAWYGASRGDPSRPDGNPLCAGPGSFCAGLPGGGRFLRENGRENPRFPAPLILRPVAAVRMARSGAPSGSRRTRQSPGGASRARRRDRCQPGVSGVFVGRGETPARLHPRCATVPRRQQKAQGRAPAPLRPRLRRQVQPAHRGQARRLDQVGHDQRHDPGAQGLLHRPQHVLGRVGSTKIRRPGSISSRTPAMWRRSGCQAGRIHRIVPSVPCASHSASRRRVGPQNSCARAAASRKRPRSGTAGPVVAVGGAGQAGEVHGSSVACSRLFSRCTIALPSPRAPKVPANRKPAGTDRCAAFRSAPPT